MPCPWSGTSSPSQRSPCRATLATSTSASLQPSGDSGWTCLAWPRSRPRPPPRMSRPSSPHRDPRASCPPCTCRCHSRQVELGFPTASPFARALLCPDGPWKHGKRRAMELQQNLSTPTTPPQRALRAPATRCRSIRPRAGTPTQPARNCRSCLSRTSASWFMPVRPCPPSLPSQVARRSAAAPAAPVLAAVCMLPVHWMTSSSPPQLAPPTAVCTEPLLTNRPPNPKDGAPVTAPAALALVCRPRTYTSSCWSVSSAASAQT
mmetsp:Transcript_16412/g.29109  ORF Transcript_16412/g.29109 Transcript_16412/m.29109 type:complete len:263 (+) Transcript_16412:1127-1915(+)